MRSAARNIFRIAFVLLLCAVAKPAAARSRADEKAVQRYEIDAKRMGVSPASEDALPRSREFLRIDSSYYVGWMFEGIYKLLHAADYIGFKNAAIPLEKALYLMERDYPKQLSTRSASLQVFYPVYNFQIDYGMIVSSLRECYANTEQPEAVVALVRRHLRWKFQKDFNFDPYNVLAWTTHRYRFYTSEKYSFLSNSTEENEALAARYLDTALLNIARNKKYNDGLFLPGYDRADKLGVYHYKCILYSYALQIDSAEKYYGLMRAGGALSHNNYANFKSVCGDFRKAEEEYKIASESESGDKRLQEWAYYKSILDINKAKPEDGVALSTDMIKGYGSTPGFGWYNIALARSLAYQGRVADAGKALEKAATFKELHIGTTLGQSHYDFSVQLQRLIQKEQLIAAVKFEDRGWWYHPRTLGKLAQMSAERLMLQYLIVDQFAENPERDRVVYKLFSTESTICWDEVWYLIKDFSTAFFVKRFHSELSQNQRPKIRKYFLLYEAKLKLKQGKISAAKADFNAVLQDGTFDRTYEKLLLARTYEGLALCAREEKDASSETKFTYLAARTFPQLMPFNDLHMPVRLQISGAQDEKLVASLKACNFDWNAKGEHFNVSLAFFAKGGKNYVRYSVKDAQNAVVVPEAHFAYKDPEAAGKELAYRICNVAPTAVSKKEEPKAERKK